MQRGLGPVDAVQIRDPALHALVAPILAEHVPLERVLVRPLAALRELVDKKLKGRKIIAPHEEGPPRGAKIIDLMDALKKSVREQGATKPKTRASKSGR